MESTTKALARLATVMEEATQAMKQAAQAAEEWLETWDGLPEDVKAAVRNA